MIDVDSINKAFVFTCAGSILGYTRVRKLLSYHLTGAVWPLTFMFSIEVKDQTLIYCSLKLNYSQSLILNLKSCLPFLLITWAFLTYLYTTK